MKVLLDTHMILWATDNNPSLPKEARDILVEDANDIYFSVASLWEITIKHMNKPDRMPATGSKIRDYCLRMGYIMLPITDRHIEMLETLKLANGSPAHYDPFDRILISQAKAEEMIFLTHDSKLSYYNEECVKYLR